MYLSELGYSELVQRLFEKMTFFLVDPLTEVLKVEREIILLKETMEKMKMQQKNVNKMMALIKMMELVMKKQGDNDSPPPLPLSRAFDKCDWAQEVKCNLPEHSPLKYQKNECDTLVHHLCQSEWEEREGHVNTVAIYAFLTTQITLK